MKYILIPLLIFFIIFCEFNSLIASQIKKECIHSQISICNILIDTNSKPYNDSSRTALEIAGKFADSYSPSREPNKGIAKLPDFPDSIKQAFQSLEKTSFKHYERNIVLIFIKIYSAHLECCHQSYDLRISEKYELDFKNEPLLGELNKLTNQYKEGVFEEFIPSNIGYDYVKSHGYLLKDEQIKEYYDRIVIVLKNIKDGVYWKE